MRTRAILDVWTFRIDYFLDLRRRPAIVRMIVLGAEPLKLVPLSRLRLWATGAAPAAREVRQRDGPRKMLASVLFFGAGT